MQSKDLSEEQTRYFQRQLLLKNWGAATQLKLAELRVLLIGVGGLGCPIAESMTRAGIGALTLVDHDRVELHNLHRQHLYTQADNKKPKAKIAHQRLSDINPWTQIQSYAEKMTPTLLLGLAEDHDLWIDATDQRSTAFFANRLARAQQKRFAFAKIAGFEAQWGYFDFSHAQSPCYACLYHPDQALIGPQTPTERGVLGSFSSAIGHLLANWVIDHYLSGKPSSMVLFSGLDPQLRQLKLRINTQCECQTLKPSPMNS